jgi:hypothetical protein
MATAILEDGLTSDGVGFAHINRKDKISHNASHPFLSSPNQSGNENRTHVARTISPRLAAIKSGFYYFKYIAWSLESVFERSVTFVPQINAGILVCSCEYLT